MKNISRLALLTTLALLMTMNLKGQNGADKIISLSFESKTLVEVLYKISTTHDIHFFFIPEELPYYALSGDFKQKPLFSILSTLTNGTKIIVVPYKEKGLLLLDRTKADKAYMEDIIAKWEDGTYDYPFDKTAKELSYRFGEKNPTGGEAKLRIRLYDETSKEAIIGAALVNADFSINGISDDKGIIELALPTGKYELTVSYLGYQTSMLSIQLYGDGNINLPMNFQSFIFDEIEVVANSLEQKLKDSESGKEVINIKEIESIPMVLGEVDIIKSLEVLPGVTSAGELSIGFNVRGGNIDESLVLFNDGIIFNPTHIVGFISAFNADILDNATLYKAYVDAEYGGRGSAILDLKSNAGDVKGWKGKGGLGSSMLKLAVEGPLTEKLDFQVSARGSFNDYLLSLIANVELQRSNANFYDLNAGFSYQLNDNHKLLFNSYLSNDLFEYNDEFGFEWSNQHLGLQWKATWSEKLYSSLSLNYGAYDSDSFTLNDPEASSFKTGLYYYKMLASLNRKIGENGFVKAGLEYIDYRNREDRLEPTAQSTLTARSIQRKGGISLSPFVTFNQKITEDISFEAGLRLSSYSSQGPGPIFFYEGEVKTPESIKGQETLDGTDSEGAYQVIEPRFSVNYNFAKNWSVKASYNKMSQNLLQLSTTNTALPSDFWTFSDRYIKPLQVNQYSFGIFTSSEKKNYSFAFDLFTKSSDHLYELRDFAEIILNEHLETELIEAKGLSYGLEALIQKRKGRWKGSIAYTYSRSLRQTVDPNQSINNGTEFPANFDIPHQVNILATYKGLPVVSFNFAYVFKSGRPTTVPTSTIIQDGIVIPIYTFKNQARIPYYSRLDFSITMDLRDVKQKGFRSSFTLGFYNLLGRNNANNVFFRRSAKGNIVPFQFSVVGSVVPNVSWNFVF